MEIMKEPSPPEGGEKSQEKKRLNGLTLSQFLQCLVLISVRCGVYSDIISEAFIKFTEMRLFPYATQGRRKSCFYGFAYARGTADVLNKYEVPLRDIFYYYNRVSSELEEPKFLVRDDALDVLALHSEKEQLGFLTGATRTSDAEDPDMPAADALLSISGLREIMHHAAVIEDDELKASFESGVGWITSETDSEESEESDSDDSQTDSDYLPVKRQPAMGLQRRLSAAAPPDVSASKSAQIASLYSMAKVATGAKRCRQQALTRDQRGVPTFPKKKPRMKGIAFMEFLDAVVLLTIYLEPNPFTSFSDRLKRFIKERLFTGLLRYWNREKNNELRASLRQALGIKAERNVSEEADDSSARKTRRLGSDGERSPKRGTRLQRGTLPGMKESLSRKSTENPIAPRQSKVSG